jgi:hypothetical protein
MVALIAESEPDAREALAELKQLEQAGWIDLIYFARLNKGLHDGVRVLEVSDPREAASESANDGLAGTLGARLFGPAAPAADAGDSRRAHALVVILEAQYAERVAEELEARGFTFHYQLRGTDRQAALRASIDRLKTNVKWLADFPRGERAHTGRNHLHDRDGLESALAAVRAELGAQREKLHSRLRALATELELDLREVRAELETEAGNLRHALDQRVDRIEAAILECGRDLALSILDHMDCLAAQAMQIQVMAAAATADVAKAFEAQLHELEVRMRRHRAELTATIGTCALRARRCVDHLHAHHRERTPSLNAQTQAIDERHRFLKANLRRLEKEDTRIWHERAACLRNSCRALFDSVHQAIQPSS